MIAGKGIHIGRLQVTVADLDGAVAVKNSLARMSARPSGLGPGAVLVVRRLADPRPGTLRTDLAQARSWERATADALSRLLADAAHPAREPVAAGTEAVVFADRAELLAALAADWLDGQLQVRWWWRVLVPLPAGAPSAVIEAFADEPRYLPAALDLLGTRAVAFARALPDTSAADLAERAAACTGRAGATAGIASPSAAAPPRLQRSVAAPGVRSAAAPGAAALNPAVRPARPRGSGPDQARQEPSQATDRRNSPELPMPPWTPWVREAAGPGLTVNQRLLLGVCLALRRAPAIVNQPWFWQAVHEWRIGTSQDAVGGRPGYPGQFALGSARASDSRLDTPDERVVEYRNTTVPARPAPPPGDLLRQVAENIGPTRLIAEAGAARVAGLGLVAGPGGNRRASVPAPSRGEDPLPPAARVPVAGRPEAFASPQPGEAVDTQLGGLFFLLNLALHLGLYGDFTTPADLGITLHPFDLLTLLGEAFLTRNQVSPIPADPVWDLLASLAGRQATDPPGRDFDPPQEWRIDPSWLDPFPQCGTLHWSAVGGRLRAMFHPEGFTVLDASRKPGSPLRQLQDELGGLACRTLVRRSLPRLPADPLRRWVTMLADYARARLANALGHPPDRAAGLVVGLQARVHVTAAHVDVAMPLTALPVEIRLAGLDRDPGWIPAAGRAVTFRFHGNDQLPHR